MEHYGVNVEPVEAFRGEITDTKGAVVYRTSLAWTAEGALVLTREWLEKHGKRPCDVQVLVMYT